MSNKQNDIIYEDLEVWLDEHSSTNKDIVSDEKGYYILIENESGNPKEEDYQVDTEKLYLPDKFQELSL